jgi:hypothetical protein
MVVGCTFHPPGWPPGFQQSGRSKAPKAIGSSPSAPTSASRERGDKGPGAGQRPQTAAARPPTGESESTTRREPGRGQRPQKTRQRAEARGDEPRPETPAEGPPPGARKTGRGAGGRRAPKGPTHPGGTARRRRTAEADRPEGAAGGGGRQAPTFVYVAA